jgi:uncharacterized membrane protein
MLVLNVESRAELLDVIVARFEPVVRTLEFIEFTRSWARLEEAVMRVTAADEDVARVV